MKVKPPCNTIVLDCYSTTIFPFLQLIYRFYSCPWIFLFHSHCLRHTHGTILAENGSIKRPLWKDLDTKILKPHYKPIPSIQKSCSRLRLMYLKGQWKDKVKEGLTQFNVFSPFSVQSLFFILWVANRWQSHHFQPLKVLKMLILCGLKGKLFQRAMSVQ